MRRHGDEWEKTLGRSAQVIKPTYGVVTHGVPIRSVNDMEKEAVVRKFELENRRVLGSHRIVSWRWLRPPKEKQRDASLVLEFETAPGANTAIHAEVLCWDSTHKRTERFDRACLVKRCFKCYHYRHIGTQCREQETCGRCSAQDHNTKECKADQPKCTLCQGKHNSWSPTCPEYKKETARMEEAKVRLRANPYWPESPVYITPGPSEIGSRISSQLSSPPLSATPSVNITNSTNGMRPMEVDGTQRQKRPAEGSAGSPIGRAIQEREASRTASAESPQRDVSPIRPKLSERITIKPKSSKKKGKAKTKEDVISSHSRSRSKQQSQMQEETIEIEMDKQADIEDNSSDLSQSSQSSQYSTRSRGEAHTPRTNISGRS